MKNLSRVKEIDMLRGIAIVAMILIHTSYYFLSNPIALFLWNYSQFAVPVFVFCSVYLFFAKDQQWTVSKACLYAKKRIIRLLKPYYLFLLVFIPLVWFFEQTRVTVSYILQSIFLVGGVDIDWLILLFVYFSFLLPLTSYCAKKKRLFVLYTSIVVVSSVIFFFHKFPINYRLIMWISWLGMIIFTYLFTQYENKKGFYKVVLGGSLGLFILCCIGVVIMGKQISLYDQKYPPTILFLTYGIGITTLLFFLAKKKVFSGIEGILLFLSKFSYSIYFIHYVILYLGVRSLHSVHFTWYTFFLSVFIPTMIVQYAIATFSKRFVAAGKG